MDKLLSEIESSTGFKCYEYTSNNQMAFFGLSSNLDSFKTVAKDAKLPTGTVLYCLDTKVSMMYYAPTDTWY